MHTDLNASAYQYGKLFYNAEFEGVLSKIIACYFLMRNEKVVLSNNENSIRDYMLYNYLKKQWFKIKYNVVDYLFDAELPENTGRIDIRVMPVNPFVNDDAYYIIECKRLNEINLNGITGLNSEYINEGISRFTSTKYSTYYKTNGMIGFVVKPLDIDKNILAINGLLKKEVSTTKELHSRIIVPSFNFSYCSTHTLNTDEITIYHLMLDFSKNIK